MLVGDARVVGRPGGVGRARRAASGTRWRRAGPADERERGRVPAPSRWSPSPLAAAAALAAGRGDRAPPSDARAAALVDRIRGGRGGVPDTEVVGDPRDRLPHVVTFSCLYVDGEALLDELDRRGFAVASGSACTSSTLEPSHVLAAMGVLTHGNVRVTLPLAGVAPDREADVERFLRGAARRGRPRCGPQLGAAGL